MFQIGFTYGQTSTSHIHVVTTLRYVQLIYNRTNDTPYKVNTDEISQVDPCLTPVTVLSHVVDISSAKILTLSRERKTTLVQVKFIKDT